VGKRRRRLEWGWWHLMAPSLRLHFRVRLLKTARKLVFPQLVAEASPSSEHTLARRVFKACRRSIVEAHQISCGLVS